MVDATHSAPLATRESLPVFNVAGATFRIFLKAMPLFLVLGLLSNLPTIVYLVAFTPKTTAFTRALAIETVVHMLFAYFLQTAMLHVAARLFEGQDYSLAEAFRLALHRWLPVLGTSILTLLAVYGGLVLLIVPGLIFACMFAVALPACALEARGPIAAMKRSLALTRFNRWRILGIYALFFVPLMISSIAVAILFTTRGNLLLGQWISIAVQIVWVPLTSIFTAAVYIALRRLKDGIGFGVASVFD